MNPGSFFKLSFVHSLVCPITHSFLDGLSQIWFSTSLMEWMYLPPVMLFSAQVKQLNLFVKDYYTEG